MRRPVLRAHVHVAGPVEPRRDGPLVVIADDGVAIVELLDDAVDRIQDDADLTCEVRCLRCDAILPGVDWKVGERVAEQIDDRDDTLTFKPHIGALRAGETDCR